MLNLEKIKEIQKKFNHTYLHGIYLAINAISDAYILIDGPFCIFDKVDFIHKTHDLFSDLIRRNSTHRICCTGVQTDQTIVVDDRSDKITNLLQKISKEKDCSVIFICSVPMATITGTQYDLIINKLQKKMPVPLIEIPSKSLRGDWLLGYEETLLSIAKNLEFKMNLKEPRSVGIVGYFFDRNEGDHIGNLIELKRILKELSLNLISVWLDGGSLDKLQEIEKAEIIISLPYGRKAAKEIARKTKVDVIELDLPFGLKNTKDWLRAIGKRINKEKQTEVLIDKELKEIIPSISLIASEYLMNKRFAINGDPYLAYALATSLRELEGEIDHIIIFGKRESANNLVSKNHSEFKTIYEPTYLDVFDLNTSKIDLFVGNSHVFYLLRMQKIKKPYIEIGYPSFYHHCLTSSPFLGFKGYVYFLNRAMNSLLENE